jgi:hypothetical protein
MTPFGDYVDEMSALTEIDDTTAEALLAGRAVAAELEQLTEVVRAYRQVADQPVRPSAELASLMTVGRSGGAAAGRPQPAVVNGRRPIGTVAGKRRRRRMTARAALAAAAGRLSGIGTLAKIGVGTAAALVGMSTAGLAGALPDQAQDRFESVVETVSPYEFPEQANDHSEFGERVSEDANEGGVDGEETSEEARRRGDENRPSELPSQAPADPANPEEPGQPDELTIPDEAGDPGPPIAPPGEERRPVTPPGG